LHGLLAKSACLVTFAPSILERERLPLHKVHIIISTYIYVCVCHLKPSLPNKTRVSKWEDCEIRVMNIRSILREPGALSWDPLSKATVVGLPLIRTWGMHNPLVRAPALRCCWKSPVKVLQRLTWSKPSYSICL
jgi:hypothetical protein